MDTMTWSRALSLLFRASVLVMVLCIGTVFRTAASGVPHGSIAVTLYRCPDANVLSPMQCTLLVAPPTDEAAIIKDLFPEAIPGFYTNGRVEWEAVQFGTWTVIHAGVLGPGEGAAVRSSSVSRRWRVWSPSALPPRPRNLSSISFPSTPRGRTATVTGSPAPYEFAGATNPNDALSPGPERSHSNLDTDGDMLSDQDEALYGTDPNNSDTDGDFIADGDEIALGTNSFMPPGSGSGAGDHDGDGLSNNDEVLHGHRPGQPRYRWGRRL